MANRKSKRILFMITGIIIFIIIGCLLIYLAYGITHAVYFSTDSVIPLVCYIGFPFLFATMFVALGLEVTKRKKFIRFLEMILFAMYSLLIIGVLLRGFRPIYHSNGLSLTEYIKFNTNIIPLKTIISYAKDYVNNTINKNIIFDNIIGNILIFSPMGFFLPCIFTKMRKAHIFIISLLIILLCLESAQLILQVGSFDVDDIILNFLGAFVIYAVVKIPRVFNLLQRLYVIK